MPFNPRRHHRRSIRLTGYDYTQPDAYFITLNAWKQKQLFGSIADGAMELSVIGKIASQQWLRLPGRFPYLELGAMMVMPDHIHGILIIKPERTGTGCKGAAESR